MELGRTEQGEIDLFRQKAIEMLEQVQAMFRISFDGLMKNDTHILDGVFKNEDKITAIYNRLTTFAVECAKEKLSDRAKRICVDLMDIIGTVERMGDCCVGLVEHIEYKISENLLFSETAVQEYEDLHTKVEHTLLDTIEVIKTEDKKLAKEIIDNKSAVDALVNKYRANHIDRSARGICGQWARVRYLDMLNCAKEIAHNCIEIVDRLTGR